MSFIKRYTLAFACIVCFVIGFFSYAIMTRFTQKPPLAFIETRHQGNYKFINPLIECDDASFQFNPNFGDIKKGINTYINQKITEGNITHASVYYRDMNNGPWFGINEGEAFSPASLIKVPLLITYYKLADKDPTILQKNISIGATFDHSNQNLPPDITLAPGKQYSVDQLIDQMIIFSDNQAYELLISNIDQNELIKTYSDLSVDITQGLSDPTGNILSVKSYASFFRILYNSSYLSKDKSEKALRLLSQIKYQDGLVASVPPVVTIAHKYGERSYDTTKEKQMHDCGIVYFPKKPYLICIMTRGKEFQKLNSVIKNISSLVYNHLNDETNQN